MCTAHSHELNTVTDMVVEEIKDRCKGYTKKIDYNSLIEQANKELGIWVQNKEREMESLKRECELINFKISSLYNDWKNGYLTESDYKRLFDNYNINRKSREQ